MSIPSLTTTTSARLLLRISHDPNDTQTGVARQRNLGKDLAKRLDWTVEDVHQDNNRSAWKRNVVRPEFERLLADIASGHVQAVIAYDQDRVSRRASQWHLFRELCVEHGVRVAFVTSNGEVNMGSIWEHGFGAMRSEEESTIKSKRVRDEQQERANDGRPANRVAYGWRRVVEIDPRSGRRLSFHDELDDHQASVVQEMTRRVLAGETLTRIANDLTDRGVVVPSAVSGSRHHVAPKWNVATVRKLILRPANVRLRVHQGKVLDDVTMQAPAILDRSEWELATAMLNDSGRRTTTSNRAIHMLSMIARCGVCGGAIRRKLVRRANTTWAGYVCRDRGCVGRQQAPVDAWVSEVVVTTLEQANASDFLGTDSTVADAAARVVVLNARLVEAEGMFTEGLIDGQSFGRMASKLRGEIEEAQAQATVAVSAGHDLAYQLATASDVALAWSRLEIEQKRAVLFALFTITINPAGKGNEHAQTVVVTQR